MTIPIRYHRAKLVVLAAVTALHAVGGWTPARGQPEFAKLLGPGELTSIPGVHTAKRIDLPKPGQLPYWLT